MLENKNMKSQRMTPNHGTVLSITNEMAFSKMSKYDLKNLPHATKSSSSSKGTSDEMMKCFCQRKITFLIITKMKQVENTTALKSSANLKQTSMTFTYLVSIYLHFLHKLMI